MMTQNASSPRVVAVSRARGHRCSKPNEMSIRLLEGLGVEGDAHMGVTVQHSYHMRKNPLAPNLRQVHLTRDAISSHQQPSAAITWSGIDLRRSPAGALKCNQVQSSAI